MRALYIHISGLVGLLVFLKEVLNYAPLERTILVAATTGLTVYLMLIVGHTIVQRIMAYSPPAPPQNAGQQQQPAQETAPSPSPAEHRSTNSSFHRPPEQAPQMNASEEAEEVTAKEEPTSEHDDTPSPTDSNQSVPDRAPNSDRPDSESSEPIPQTTA